MRDSLGIVERSTASIAVGGTPNVGNGALCLGQPFPLQAIGSSYHLSTYINVIRIMSPNLIEIQMNLVMPKSWGWRSRG